VRHSDIGYISSQVKSGLSSTIQVTQRLRKGKDRDWALFMSDVPLLYKSYGAHMTKSTTLFAEF